VVRRSGGAADAALAAVVIVIVIKTTNINGRALFILENGMIRTKGSHLRILTPVCLLVTISSSLPFMVTI
jgi:hypothetical protein